jgi:hypothetical protein
MPGAGASIHTLSECRRLNGLETESDVPTLEGLKRNFQIFAAAGDCLGTILNS